MIGVSSDAGLLAADIRAPMLRRYIIPGPKSIDLKAPGTGNDQGLQADTPGGPITGNGVVPCSWQKARLSGPMSVAGDNENSGVPLPGLRVRRSA